MRKLVNLVDFKRTEYRREFYHKNKNFINYTINENHK